MSTETPSGPSSVVFEAPDTLVWRVIGDISGTEMLRLRDMARALSEGKPYMLALVDLSRSGAVSAEARKVAIDNDPVSPLFGSAIFGASFTMRVVAQLVTRAASLLHPQHESPLEFFATEALARAWIVKRREAVLAKGR